MNRGIEMGWWKGREKKKSFEHDSEVYGGMFWFGDD
jgi:hypothetical protein